MSDVVSRGSAGPSVDGTSATRAREHHRLPYDPASATRARGLLRGFLDTHELPRATAMDAVIVLGELIANGLAHGSPLHDDTIEVAFELDPGPRLTLMVKDGGGQRMPEMRSVDRYAERGRGLAMVDTICDTWQVDRGEGTLVRAEIA